jgi:DNA oxidative demethylase
MPYGLYYDAAFLSPADRRLAVEWLERLHPIWEWRFSAHHPPPEGKEQRRLLRPVYWLGNWQFACLNYYHPPRGIKNRCVRAEPFPKWMQNIVDKIERLTRKNLRPSDIPRGWRLNTCLINLYGRRLENEKWIDTARVGEHKDFEPGPVASLSLGERAIFQFVSSRGRDSRAGVEQQQWLEDRSLQIFGGPRWKEHLFHRVQRVDRRGGHRFALKVEGFETRRVNFTFRFVPEEHWVDYKQLPEGSRTDLRPYIEELARHSSFFARILSDSSRPSVSPV